MTINKIYIFLAALTSVCVCMLVVLPIGGISIFEIISAVAAMAIAGWLGWHFYLEAKMLVVQVDSLKNDYIQQRDKAGEATKFAKDQKLQVQLLKRQQRNTEGIIYSISDAVLVTDGSGRLVMANEPAGELFDFDAEKASLGTLKDFINDTDIVDLIEKSIRSKTRHMKHELVFDEGQESQKIYNCVLSCIFDDDIVCGVVCVFHDITREKEISQMKNEFVSHVSHELKTPLASITAYSEMLADGEANDEKTRKEFYSIIQNQAQRLNRLIEDILNVSRIESGLIKVSKESISTALIVRDAVQMIKSYAADKDIAIEEDAAIVFDQVKADKDMISQVVINLLSNAVKYTPNGGKVTVDSEVDEAAQVVRVRVSDTGVGIPVDDIEHIFDKFYRVQANNKCAKGTGLGLNLVKQIVEKVHGGKVFVTSEVGKGSCFSFELPLMAAEKVLVN